MKYTGHYSYTTRQYSHNAMRDLSKMHTRQLAMISSRSALYDTFCGPHAQPQ